MLYMVAWDRDTGGDPQPTWADGRVVGWSVPIAPPVPPTRAHVVDPHGDRGLCGWHPEGAIGFMCDIAPAQLSDLGLDVCAACREGALA